VHDAERPAVLADALAAARAITDTDYKARVLTGLAPHPPPNLLAAARAITDPDSRAETLTGLAPHLPPTCSPTP
jgi:hypothetical protein